MNDNNKILKKNILISTFLILAAFLPGCSSQETTFSSSGEIWGIYQLDLNNDDIQLVYGGEGEIIGLSLDPSGNNLVFSQNIGQGDNQFSEIYSYSLPEQKVQQLTNNDHWDVYPVWSPDGKEIAFLSWRDESLDIYTMDNNGSNQELLYDSGFHDADIDWVGDQIVFTQQSHIWKMKSDGSQAEQITISPRAGEWGQANLPFGDYDPRLSPDGNKILFSRMIGDQSVHGNYDIFIVDLDGSNLINLTNSGYSQGLSSWSHDGSEILYILAASGDIGLYDLYTMNSDGTEAVLRNPSFVPDDFLIHWARYSADPMKFYLVGEWWIE